MSDKSPIEWTDATWNPLRGCSRVSEGCRHCYAEGVAARFSGPGMAFEGLAVRTSQGPKWTGKVRTVPELLMLPLTWREPRRIFANSMSDLFHEDVPEQFIVDVFGIMALSPWHTYQVLTKRPMRALNFLRAGDHGIIQQFQTIQQQGGTSTRAVFRALDRRRLEGHEWKWPLPNVQIGVSIEDQQTAAVRMPVLQAIPAAVRFVSAEPLLARVKIDPWLEGVHWVICGGESGKGARPMHPEWAQSLRDQCEAFGVKFFFKQWGEWGPADIVAANAPQGRSYEPEATIYANPGGTFAPIGHGNKPGPLFFRAGKSITGRLLDGREHNEQPSLEKSK